ncbi:serine O-acetyltransferase [Bartonella sp. DGB2]|uniref:serine O-acetyltransferase n=1 Tax=Bartonella sp. DGB2 TaxID=3388426 RepID=UPI00398F987E
MPTSILYDEIPEAKPIWETIRIQTQKALQLDPALQDYFEVAILNHARLFDAVAACVAARLETAEMPRATLYALFDQTAGQKTQFERAVEADLMAFLERDPACHRYIEPILYFKGFIALQTHRFAHIFWNQGRKDFAYFLQGRASCVFQVDIHPAAILGQGLFLDHATGLVIGETAVVEDNVSILHGVTLGGTGKECGNRHPKIRQGVLIGAGAKILGNIEIGACAKIAAGSLVLNSVSAHVTVAGVPAKIIARHTTQEPALTMDQALSNH